MVMSTIICFIGAFFCTILATLVFLRDRRSFVHWTFGVGMMVLAFEAALTGVSIQTALPVEVIRWQRLREVATAILPGIWLLFSINFGRATYKETILKWRWGLMATFIIPLVLVTLFGKFFYRGESILYESFIVSIRLGWSGYLFYLFLLISSIFILINLERTFRSSAGVIRWQIKFIVLSIGGIFAFRIYSVSQTLLFSSVMGRLELLNAGTLIVSCMLLTLGLSRMQVLTTNIHLSQKFIFNSVMLLIAGVYLLSVGFLAKVVRYLNSARSLPIEALFVFLALMGLTVLLMSERLRQRMRQLISRHFKEPRYDYRKEWREFTKRTVFLTDIKSLCAEVVKMISEAFGTSSVTIWLLDEQKDCLQFGGSTALSDTQGGQLKWGSKSSKDLILAVNQHQMPIDFESSEEGWVAEFKDSNSNFLQEARIRYCVPLVLGNNPIGLLTLDDRIVREPFSIEDFELLKTVADQTAGNLLNLKLSEQLHQVREVEAYQTMSAFMMHDLKNLASKLSMTVENMPIHIDDPEFQKDALRAISDSVNRINNMCSHLSLLRQKIELKTADTDLNELLKNTLVSLNGCKNLVKQNLNPLLRLPVDADQIQKVITNLILNANEAVGREGEIQVTTEQRGSWAIVSVSDNGCGMSREFLEKSLFRPFKTTKKHGMGIGLFHSKMIVEAHHGKIEVESQEGKGTTFKVLLPLVGK